MAHDEETVSMEDVIAFSSPEELTLSVQDRARHLVVEEFNSKRYFEARNGQIFPTLKLEEVYVVWSVKVLQNWKALLSTSRPDGRYYEITYDGDKCQAYVDTYFKVKNTTYRDTPKNLLESPVHLAGD